MVSRIVAELQSRGFLVWFDCEWTKTNTLGRWHTLYYLGSS